MMSQEACGNTIGSARAGQGSTRGQAGAGIAPRGRERVQAGRVGTSARRARIDTASQPRQAVVGTIRGPPGRAAP